MAPDSRKEHNRIILRPTLFARAVVTAAALLPTVGVAQLFPSAGWTWLVSVLGGLAAIGAVAVIDVWIVQRVELRDDALVVVGLAGATRCPVGDIEGVSIEEGVVYVRRANQRPLRLPAVGSPRSTKGAVETWSRRRG